MHNIPNLICDAGHKAILEARTIWGGMQENEIREEFVSALMAGHLHRALDAPVRVEIDYAAIYGQLGLEITPEVINSVMGFRADIVIYRQDGERVRPQSIIEVKKFAEGANVNSIIADLHKGDPIELPKHLQIYVGIFVCETTNQKLEERMKTLEKAAVKQPILFSSPQRALKGWLWCFGCVSYSAQTEPGGLSI
jgi:hypothetical protein